MRTHYLKANKTTRTPSNHIFVDTETIPRRNPSNDYSQIHEFRLACAAKIRIENFRSTRRQEIATNSKENFWRWIYNLLDTERPTWVWTHNVGFDFSILDGFNWVGSVNGKFNPIIIEDPPTIIGIEINGKKMLWIDTLNWWRCPLSELGESVGIPKLPMPEFTDPDKSWFAYCKNDVA